MYNVEALVPIPKACRPADPSRYYLSYNGRLGSLVLDSELAALSLVSAAKDRRGAPAEPAPGGAAAAAGAAKSEAPLSASSPAQSAGAPARRAADVTSFPLDITADAREYVRDPSSTAAASSAAAGAGAAALENGASTQVRAQERVHSDGKGLDKSSSRVHRVLVGHSVGGVCAALEATAHCEDISALILVAPAIIALGAGFGGGRRLQGVELHEWSPPDGGASDGAGPSAATAALARADSEPLPSNTGAAADGKPDAVRLIAVRPGDRPGAVAAAATGNANGTADGHAAVYEQAANCEQRRLEQAANPGLPRRALRAALSLLQAAAAGAALLALLLARPLVVALLRTLVRSRTFWERGLAAAYHDPSRVTRAAIDAYRLPQAVRGWEAGLINFVAARFSYAANAAGVLRALFAAAPGAAAGSGSAGAAAAGAAATAGGLEDANLAQRLADAVAAAKVPVLIVHGVQDAIVPASNSRRLLRVLPPGAELLEYKKCGHMPHEEWPEAFVDDVAEFLNRRLGKGLK